MVNTNRATNRLKQTGGDKVRIETTPHPFASFSPVSARVVGIYSATVYGSSEDKPLGNPIPYFRQTQGSYFNKGSKRYHAWKDYVRNSSGIEGLDSSEGKMYMAVVIFFKDKAHGDPDNIAKGIADALFVNDKYLATANDFHYDKHHPRVEIYIYRETQD